MVLTRCIQSKTLCVISHFAKTVGHILFRPFCCVVHACRIAGFCFLFVSSIYENWSISTTKPMHSMVIYSRPVFFFFFFGHCPNFLLNVRNIWSHFGQSVRKTFAYSMTIARACSGSMLIKFTKILRVSFCN